MNAGEKCRRDVVVAYRDMSVAQAARLMRKQHVGSLVVVDSGEHRKPIGMLTDRDLTIAVIAEGLDPSTLTVGDVMTTEVFTVNWDDTLSKALLLMRERGVRRMPVCNRNGTLLGILTLDDVLDMIAEQLENFAGAIAKERAHETSGRS